MAYATLTDLQAQMTAEELALLCDDSGQGLLLADAEHTPAQAAAAAAALAVAERALEDASAVVDGYVGVRHVVPLPAPTTFIVGITTSLAIYALYTRRNLAGASEGRKDRHDAALRSLEHIAKGLISLGGSDSPFNSAGSVSGLKTRADRLFTSDSLADF